MEHLKDYFPHKLYKRYTQDLLRARKLLMTKRGHAIPETYKRYFDELSVDKCIWNPYVDHRELYPLLEVAWYRGWIMCGRGRMARHLSDRVLRQYGHVQKIPRHPTHYVPQMEVADIIQAFIHFQNHVMPLNQRGRECSPNRPWKPVHGDMSWFEQVSHPRALPQVQPEGNESPPPRPFNEEVLITQYHERAGTSSVADIARGALQLIVNTYDRGVLSHEEHLEVLTLLYQQIEPLARRGGMQPHHHHHHHRSRIGWEE